MSSFRPEFNPFTQSPYNSANFIDTSFLPENMRPKKTTASEGIKHMQAQGSQGDLNDLGFDNNAPNTTGSLDKVPGYVKGDRLAGWDLGTLGFLRALEAQKRGQMRDWEHGYNADLDRIMTGQGSLPADYMKTRAAGPWDIFKGQQAQHTIAEQKEIKDEPGPGDTTEGTTYANMTNPAFFREAPGNIRTFASIGDSKEEIFTYFVDTYLRPALLNISGLNEKGKNELLERWKKELKKYIDDALAFDPRNPDAGGIK